MMQSKKSAWVSSSFHTPTKALRKRGLTWNLKSLSSGVWLLFKKLIAYSDLYTHVIAPK